MTNSRSALRLTGLFLISLSTIMFFSSCAAMAAPNGNNGKKPPVVSGVSPAATTPVAQPVMIYVSGANFRGKDSVLWNGKSRPTTIISSSQAQATLLSTDTASPGTAQVAVLDASTGLISNAVTFTVVQPAALAVTTTSLPSGTVGATYAASLSASGGTAPYAWTVVSGQLPAGLGLASSGAISGTPTTAGQFSFQVQVADSSSPQQTSVQSLTISVASAPSAPAPLPLQITTSSTLPTAIVGGTYSTTLTATGGTVPYTWAVISGSLPSSITLNASTGVLSGVPSTAGTYNVGLQVQDSAQQATNGSFTLTVSASSASATLDQYGGTTATPQCANATGFFHFEKIGTQWWVCDPLGNRFFKQGLMTLQAGCGTDHFNNNFCNAVKAKYGDTDTAWAEATMQRIKNWGFNTVDLDASGSFLHTATRTPYLIYKANSVLDALRAYVFSTTQNKLDAAITENVKNWAAAWTPLYADGSIYTTGAGGGAWRPGSGVGDYFDDHIYSSLEYKLINDTFWGGLRANPDPYFLGLAVDDGDNLYGFPGGDQQGNPEIHLGWAAIGSAPQMGAARASSGPYHFFDTEVKTKTAIVDFLKQKYGTVSALNAAWGSTYSACDALRSSADGFGSCGIVRSAEPVGTPNGSTRSFTHSFANPTATRFSVVVKVNGTPIAGEIDNGTISDTTHGTVFGPVVGGSIDRSASSGAGAITVMFPNLGSSVAISQIMQRDHLCSCYWDSYGTDAQWVGVTTATPHNLQSGWRVTISGTSSYNGVSAAITVTDSTHFTYWSGGYTRATESTGSLLPYVSASILNASISSNVATVQTQEQHPLWTGARVTITGTGQPCYDRVNPTVTVLDSHRFTFPYTGSCPEFYATNQGATVHLTAPPQTGDTLTVDYVQNGWGIGNGLLDEDGRHTWLGNSCCYLDQAHGINANAKADLDEFFVRLADHYFGNTKAAVDNSLGANSPIAPGYTYLGPDSIALHNVPPATASLRGAAPYIAVLITGNSQPYTAQQLATIYNNLGDKPIWEGLYLSANADSPWYGYVDWAEDRGAMQEGRGQKFYDAVNYLLTAAYPNGSKPYAGYAFWGYMDNSDGAGINWGLVDFRDNAYDGHENVTGAVPCSPPLESYTCGGEPGYPVWQASHSYSPPGNTSTSWGNRIQVSIGGTYYVFEATNSGVSGGNTPNWAAATALNAMVVDGSVTWKNDGVKTNPNGFGDAITKIKAANSLFQGVSLP